MVAFGQETSQAVAVDVGWRSKVEVVLLLAAELNSSSAWATSAAMPLDGGPGMGCWRLEELVLVRPASVAVPTLDWWISASWHR